MGRVIFNKLPLGLKGLWSLTWKATFLNRALLELARFDVLNCSASRDNPTGTPNHVGL